MKQPDQLAKRILTEETSEATHQHVAFDVSPEVPVGALTPDGVVRVVSALAAVAPLPFRSSAPHRPTGCPRQR